MRYPKEAPVAIIVGSMFPCDEWEVAEPSPTGPYIRARWVGCVEWRSLDARYLRAYTETARALLRAAREGR